MNKSLLIVGGSLAIAIALIVIGGPINQPATNSHGLGNLTPPVKSQEPSVDNLASSYPTLGDENAPIELVEFGDYQCTFCTKFFKETEPTLIQKYVNEGILKIKFKDYPVNGKESGTAALGATCANEQGKFWEYHDKLFNERKGYDVGVFTEKNLIKFAGELGLDTDQFSGCYKSQKYQSQISQDLNHARALGARGTPTFFLNGTIVPGAQPLSYWESAFEQILNQ